MHLTNKTSTITVALVAALVALAIVSRASGALTLSPSQTAWHERVQVPAGPGSRGTPPGSGSASRGAVPHRRSNSVRTGSVGASS